MTYDDEVTTVKIALAHLREFPDYYTRLAKMEQEAEGILGGQAGRLTGRWPAVGGR